MMQEEITMLLQRGAIKDPRVALATISEVRVTKDLRQAKVYVQVIGTPEERASTVTGLSSAAGFIRRELAKVMSMRVVPELRFVADDTAEKADRVLGLLAGLERDRAAKTEPAADSESDDDESGADDDE